MGDDARGLGQEALKVDVWSNDNGRVKVPRHGRGNSCRVGTAIVVGFGAEDRGQTGLQRGVAMVSGRGLEKRRHIELRCLWVDEMTNSDRVKIRREPGTGH